MPRSTQPPIRGKTAQIRSLLESRIRFGEYQLRSLPSERKLASELGVSRMTARKAIQQLLDSDLLNRLPNGEIIENRSARPTLRIAALVPTLASRDLEVWRHAIQRVAERHRASVRTVLYIHWDDLAIEDALRSFDGVFISPSCEPIPDRLISRLRSAACPVVVLGRDLSSEGLPSIDLFPAVLTQRLLDHLAGLGHRAVDCFNVQTIDPVIQQRIAQWNVWRSAHGFAGRLLGEPVRAYDEPIVQAYSEVRRLLELNAFQHSAVFCTTVPAALGLMRGLREHGIGVGTDCSGGVMNDEGLAPFITPTITSIPMPDPMPFLAPCLDWFQRRRDTSGHDNRWFGPLLLQPTDVPIFAGESTGPANNR
ncbi:MAG TPA: GntR family transcriptional regulator [Tepidisphaeraceae bacterium]|nr:GntR family transcriptional regulator [Tepidisphaeraceae bacterium]